MCGEVLTLGGVSAIIAKRLAARGILKTIEDQGKKRQSIRLRRVKES